MYIRVVLMQQFNIIIHFLERFLKWNILKPTCYKWIGWVVRQALILTFNLFFVQHMCKRICVLLISTNVNKFFIYIFFFCPQLFMSSQQSPANLQSSVDRDKIYQWIVELSNPETRENALQELRCFEFTVTVTVTGMFFWILSVCLFLAISFVYFMSSAYDILGRVL